MTTIDTEYPRPQLVRDRWVGMDGEWGFAFDDGDIGLGDRWFTSSVPFDRNITVPYPPESKLSGVHDPTPHAVVWYRRAVVLPAPGPDERVILHFGAVDYAASVWVNGEHVGDHEGGHTPFSFDITAALTGHDEQVLVVRAEDQAGDISQPRGKQDWEPEPHAIWYHRTTGIWQPVWAEVVNTVHLTDVHWTPHVAGAKVTLEAGVSRLPEGPCRLRITLAFGDELLAEETVRVTEASGHWYIAIPAARHGQDLNRLMWSPESPNLLDAKLELLDRDDRPLDVVQSYLGLRSVSTEDGRFLLNGRPYFLRLALEQGYWPDSHLAAPSAQALRREAELVKDLGFNGVRIHQKVEDPRFLAWCDRLGLLVWDEMPSAFEFAPKAVGRLTREWMEVVHRDRSHPCVVAWVPFNESWGIWHVAEVAEQQHYATALYHLTRALDGTRPVISNDGWEHTQSDIWGVHDYAPRGASLRDRYDGAEAVRRALHDRWPGRKRVLLGDAQDRGQPVMLTEFGGLSYNPAPGEKWFGYGTVASQEELTERLRDLVDAILDNPELAGFCYTQLTDTEQERNGLLTEDRQPKLLMETVRGILSRPAQAVPHEEIDANRRAVTNQTRADD